MKQSVPAQTLANGSVEPAYDLEATCTHCENPESEATTENLCNICNSPWQPTQSVTLHATTFPPVNVGLHKFI